MKYSKQIRPTLNQRIPFDWHNPIDYSIAVALQLVMVSYSMCYLGSFLSLAFSFLLCAISIAKNLKRILKSIKKRTRSKRKRLQLLKQFIKLHHLYADMKQLSSSKMYAQYHRSTNLYVQFQLSFIRLLDCFKEVYKPTLTIMFVGASGIICLALLMIQIAIVQVTCLFWTILLHHFNI